MLTKGRVPRALSLAVALAVTAPIAALAGPAAASPFEDTGAVYTSTNSPTGNAVVAFNRAGDGSLTPAGSFPTGGTGTGGGLGNQGAVVLDHRRDLLFRDQRGQRPTQLVQGHPARASPARPGTVGRRPAGQPHRPRRPALRAQRG